MNKKKESFEKSLKLLVKTSFIVFIGILLSKVLAYVYRIIIARFYGPEAYGLFSIAIMILGWIISFSSLGFAEGLLRFIPQYRAKNEERKVAYLFKFAWVTLLITSLISALLLFSLSNKIALSLFHNLELAFLLKIVSVFIPIAVLSNLTLVSLRAYELIGSYSFVSNILQNVVRVCSILVLGIFGFNSSFAVLSYCIGFLAVLLASFLICKYKIPQLFIKIKKEKTLKKQFLQYSIPLLFFGIVSMIFYWIDTFFIGYYKGAEAVGYYNAAVPIATLLLVIPELFMQLFFPMINREYCKKQYGLIKDLSKQLGKWIFAGNYPIFILIFVFPGAAINLLFGQEYLVAESTLRILIFGTFFSSIFIISNNLLSMIGKSRTILIDMVFACLINTILNYILIPMENIFFIENSLGINGAALATVLSLLFLNFLFFYQAKVKIKIIPFRIKMLNILIIGAICASILAYVRTLIISKNLFLIAALAGAFILLYLFLIVLTKTLDEHDLEIISAIKRKFLYNTK